MTISELRPKLFSTKLFKNNIGAPLPCIIGSDSRGKNSNIEWKFSDSLHTRASNAVAS